MGNTEFLNLFHIFNSIRSCVQNYFFTPEIEIVKQLKNNEVMIHIYAFSKALKKPLNWQIQLQQICNEMRSEGKKEPLNYL